MATPKPLVLIILDGWGESSTLVHNPIAQMPTPHFDQLFANYPYTFIEASGNAVGLPEGQMGNSEVGHLHLGAGRKVPQDFTRIRQAIDDESFNHNPVFLEAIQQAKTHDSAIHILGLLSPGGVHSHERQIQAIIKLITKHGVNKNYLHAILDGRDTPPKSATASLSTVGKLYEAIGHGQIASICGRYYAMDRDQRWDRTKLAYDLLTIGKADHTANNPVAAITAAYDRGETDEFVKPTTIIDPATQKPITINDNDVVIFMNFRADRARQLTQALTQQEFTGFKREIVPKLQTFVSLTIYAKELPTTIAFPPTQPQNTLGEFLSLHHLRQLRIAETEKYAHVTYFLNGGREEAFVGEDRVLIPSPKVATYDLQPEMSCYELTNTLCDAITSQKYDVIVCNYANPDMVGHTGIAHAANRAVVVVDECIGQILSTLKQVNGEAVITADHGNIETMFNPETKQPHTAHTANLVPLIYFGRPASFIVRDGALDDVAPTMLHLLGLNPPTQMTGRNLLKLK